MARIVSLVKNIINNNNHFMAPLISPPGFSRQAYVMLLLLSFFFLFFFFLTIAWSKGISETTRPIFSKFSGVADMLV